MRERGYRFIIAGGGTGGHIFPAIAIARALRVLVPDAEFLFVGADGKMEMEKVPQAGFRIAGIPMVGFDRSSLMKNFRLPFKLLASLVKVKRIFKQFKPDAVIGVGGYSTYPVLRYAQAKGIPTFIHEANSYAGKSNILLGKKASIVFVANEGMESFFPTQHLVISGNPIRKELWANTVSKEEARKHFGLSADVSTVLVMGGSLGARSINEAVRDMLELFEEKGVQLIWQTGKSGRALVDKFDHKEKGIMVSVFIDRMDLAYAAADVVISRSGAMSVAEISAVQKPAIFVPYPLAAEDHQTANARFLKERDAAIMIADKEVRGKLKIIWSELMEDKYKQQQLSEEIGKYAHKNADELIAKKIITYIQARD